MTKWGRTSVREGWCHGFRVAPRPGRMVGDADPGRARRVWFADLPAERRPWYRTRVPGRVGHRDTVGGGEVGPAVDRPAAPGRPVARTERPVRRERRSGPGRGHRRGVLRRPWPGVPA